MKLIEDRTVQLLLEEARYLDTKDPQLHDMTVWGEKRYCGTASCAIGDMLLRGRLGGYFFDDEEDDEDDWVDTAEATLYAENWCTVSELLGIDKYHPEFDFLFAPSSALGTRDKETPQETAARLRKYVYYKLRKREIFRDYERARRTGDIGVAAEVLEQVKNDIHPVAVDV